MEVFAVTSAVPLNPRSAEFLSVTCANMASNAPLLTEVNGTLWKVIGKAATFPVDTPPTLLDRGSFNYEESQSHIKIDRERILPERRLCLHS